MIEGSCSAAWWLCHLMCGRSRTFRTRFQDLEGYADRKSTRLNSSHLVISYAVFCLKKKKAIPLVCATGFNASGTVVLNKITSSIFSMFANAFTLIYLNGKHGIT